MTGQPPDPAFKPRLRWLRKPKPDDPDSPQAPTGVQSVPPDKPYVSGFAQPHQTSLLKLNVEGEAGQAQRHPDTPAGQHATGSFTGPGPDPAEDDKK